MKAPERATILELLEYWRDERAERCRSEVNAPAGRARRLAAYSVRKLDAEMLAKLEERGCGPGGYSVDAAIRIVKAVLAECAALSALALCLASCGAPFTSAQNDPPDVGPLVVLEYDASDETAIFSGSSGLTSDAGAPDAPADSFAQNDPSDASPIVDDASTVADCIQNFDRACAANPSGCTLSICVLCPGACEQ